MKNDQKIKNTQLFPLNAVVVVWIVPYTQSDVQDLNLNHTPSAY